MVLLIALALFLGEPSRQAGYGTSHDASTTGFRAAYLLLDELGYPVERSRRPTGGAVRWLLFPQGTTEKDVAVLDDWVRRGNRVLLADAKGNFAERLGITLRPSRATGASEGEPATAPDVSRLAGGSVRVEIDDPPVATWGTIGGRPLVTVLEHGQGEVWVLHRPEVLRNDSLRQADNAVLACRLAEAMLADRPGPLAFDEYYHGLRDRPDVLALLWQPPMRWVTVQVLAFAGLLLWRAAPRFGPLRPLPPPNRRSKEEFLDALADLLHRKGDTADAFRTLQRDLLRRLEADLGLPPGTSPEQAVAAAARRRGVPAERHLRILTAGAPPGGPGPSALLEAIHELDAASRELLPRRVAARPPV
jgi:hypothetical protein